MKKNIPPSLLSDILANCNTFYAIAEYPGLKKTSSLGQFENVFSVNPFKKNDSIELDGEFCHPEDRKYLKTYSENIHQNNLLSWEALIRMKGLNTEWSWIFCKYDFFEKNSEGFPTTIGATFIKINKDFIEKDQLTKFLEEVFPQKPNITDLLSKRELTILKLTAQGLSYTEISKQLHIQPDTVNRHRANIMKKLNIHGIAQLTCYAVQNGLI